MSNRSAAQVAPILPRFIRAGEAYGYLGMCRDEFNKTVRPNVREFPIGKQGIGFDRLELDEWADRYIESMAIEKAANQDNNRPRSERQGKKKGATPWPKKQSPAPANAERHLEDRQKVQRRTNSREYWHL
ncbi:putative DNA-binding transcriptional regulator AlpA [Pseudomonas sp. 2957]|nr:putative DNA-binding transcriptional regulator AlpA [Pseudomonas sp. 2957]